ncbi:2-amino-3-ketobutyrate coenzyme A ligase [Algibacter lectus]|uniref:2-amino-3-ketobutyrate coenzyme A ligase n=1 Tax=Algibacter lectus TaxID=221126 RepID=A0A090WZ23_9FLAO|nr:2-amino-3-ketobutyrate coenzyme A ligase [Algibacter lectus]
MQTLNDHQLNQVHLLYNNVRLNNLGLNTFPYPINLFRNMSEHSNWEFILIHHPEQPNKIIGVMFCYKNNNQTYVPSLVGIDYDYLKIFQTYRQLLYQTLKRAIQLKFKTIDLGMTASFEKKKLGAVVEEKYAYIQTSDNYTLELLGLLEFN